VKEAELLPQIPVLTEDVQCGRGLSQVDDVEGVGELVEDCVLRVERQVAELCAVGNLLHRGRITKAEFVRE